MAAFDNWQHSTELANTQHAHPFIQRLPYHLCTHFQQLDLTLVLHGGTGSKTTMTTSPAAVSDN